MFHLLVEVLVLSRFVGYRETVGRSGGIGDGEKLGYEHPKIFVVSRVLSPLDLAACMPEHLLLLCRRGVLRPLECDLGPKDGERTPRFSHLHLFYESIVGEFEGLVQRSIL